MYQFWLFVVVFNVGQVIACAMTNRVLFAVLWGVQAAVLAFVAWGIIGINRRMQNPLDAVSEVTPEDIAAFSRACVKGAEEFERKNPELVAELKRATQEMRGGVNLRPRNEKPESLPPENE